MKDSLFERRLAWMGPDWVRDPTNRFTVVVRVPSPNCLSCKSWSLWSLAKLFAKVFVIGAWNPHNEFHPVAGRWCKYMSTCIPIYCICSELGIFGDILVIAGDRVESVCCQNLGGKIQKMRRFLPPSLQPPTLPPNLQPLQTLNPWVAQLVCRSSLWINQPCLNPKPHGQPSSFPGSLLFVRGEIFHTQNDGPWKMVSPSFKYGHFWVSVWNFWGVYFPPPKKLPRESALALQTGNNTWRLLVFSVGFCEDFW